MCTKNAIPILNEPSHRFYLSIKCLSTNPFGLVFVHSFALSKLNQSQLNYRLNA
jgi:hypothetical protein